MSEKQTTEEHDCPSCGGRGFWDGSGQTCTDCGGEGVAGVDIVARLLGAGHSALADEAAHEIEALRDALRAMLAADDHWLRGNKDAAWAGMMAEARAKARAALREVKR